MPIPLSVATRDQLMAYATTVLGLDVPRGANAVTLQARIRAATTAEEIPDDVPGIEPADPVAPRPKIGRSGYDTGSGDPLVRINVPAQDTEDGERPVLVAVNGQNYLIPRGQPCDVPYRYFLALKNAAQVIGRQTEGGDIIYTEVDAYPHSVLVMPTEAEIRAWHARTDDLVATPLAAAAA